MRRLPRRLAAGLALLLVALGGAAPGTPALVGAAAAQEWPDRPIKMVVPYPAGGSVDVLARIVAQALTTSLGRQVVIENKAGATGMIGTDAVAKAAPDGYTLVMGGAGALAANVALFKSMPYHPIRDLTAISLVAIQPNIVIVHPSLPVRTIGELVALAKAKPGTLHYGTSGKGGPQHMAAALFAAMAGIDLVHVPYRGGAPASADLIAGQIQLIFHTSPEALPLIQAGQAVPIAVTTGQRLAILPALPTVKESGLPGYETRGFIGLAGPPGLPAPIVARLHAEVAAAARQPDVRRRLTDLGLDPVATPPAEMTAFLEKEISDALGVVAATGISAE